MILCEFIFTRTEIVNIYKMKVKMEVAQSRLNLWPHGLYSPWNSLVQNTGVGSLSLFQEIFPGIPVIESRSPILQADSLPPEPQASILDRTLLSKRSMDEAKGRKITQILKLPIGGTLPISFSHGKMWMRVSGLLAFRSKSIYLPLRA